MALLVALITVAGTFGPIIGNLILGPKVLLDTGIAIRNECIMKNGCDAEDSSYHTHLDLSIANYGEVDVLLADTLTCNNAVAVLGDYAIGEDWIIPHFSTADARFLKAGEAIAIDYAYLSFQNQTKRYYGNSAMLCALELRSHPGQYAIFSILNNEISSDVGIVDVNDCSEPTTSPYNTRWFCIRRAMSQER